MDLERFKEEFYRESGGIEPKPQVEAPKVEAPKPSGVMDLETFRKEFEKGLEPPQVPKAPPPGMVSPGNIDLAKRPVVKNPDGTISTLRSMSFQDQDKREVLIPTLDDDGAELSPEQAIQKYRNTGQHLGKFDSTDSANAYAKQLSRDQEAKFKVPEALAPSWGPFADWKTSKERRLARHFAGGAIGTAEGLAGAIQWITGGALGQDFANYMGDLRHQITPRGEPTFPEMLAGGAGSMATFFIPGAGVGRASQLLNLTPKAAAWLGATTMAVTEAATEAGLVYRDEIQKGVGEDKAGNAAAWTFWLNLPVLVLTDKISFFGDKGGALARALKGMVTEGSQESLQEVISTWSKGEQQDLKNILLSGAVGGIIGGGLGAVAYGGEGKAKPPRPEAEILEDVGLVIRDRRGLPREEAPRIIGEETAPGPSLFDASGQPLQEGRYVEELRQDELRKILAKPEFDRTAEEVLFLKRARAEDLKAIEEGVDVRRYAGARAGPLVYPAGATAGVSVEEAEAIRAGEAKLPPEIAPTRKKKPGKPFEAPEEPPGSAPSRAGGGGTVGISPTTKETKDFYQWIGQEPEEVTLINNIQEYLEKPGTNLVFDNQVFNRPMNLRLNKKTMEIQAKVKNRWRTIDKETLDNWSEAIGLKEEAPPTPIPMGTPGVDTENASKPPPPPKPPLPSDADALARATTTGNKGVAKAADGTKVPYTWGVVELDDIITSHDIDLQENPAHGLQPRKREAAPNELELAELQNKYDTEYPLEIVTSASQGAPILGPDMKMESGNGRSIIFMRLRASNDPRWAEYRDKLVERAENYGLDPDAIEGMNDPVLVRIRTSVLNQGERQELVQKMNIPDVKPLSGTEYAKTDARALIDGDILDIYNPDFRLDTGENRAFRSAFIGRIIGTKMAGEYVDESGATNDRGYSRIRQALFALAYQNSEALERLANKADDPARNVSDALLRAAPRVAKAEREIGKGNYYPMSIARSMGDAASIQVWIKENVTKVPAGMTPYEYYQKQQGLFEKPPPLTLDILSLYQTYSNAPKKLATIFDEYYKAVEQLGNPKQQDMFGTKLTPEEITPETLRSLLNAATRLTEGEIGEMPDFLQKEDQPDERLGDTEAGVKRKGKAGVGPVVEEDVGVAPPEAAGVEGKESFEGERPALAVGDRAKLGDTDVTILEIAGGKARIRMDNATDPRAYFWVDENLLRPPTGPEIAYAKLAEFEETKGELGADKTRLVELLGATMYDKDIGEIAVKELMQNAFDAIKEYHDTYGTKKAGDIKIEINNKDRSITIIDTGIGMNREILKNAFFTIGGTHKRGLSPRRRSGGLGLAKMAFMFGAERIEVTTTRDGETTIVSATSDDIINDNFVYKHYKAKKGEHGTTVKVFVPKSRIDPKTGEESAVPFWSAADTYDSLKHPLIGNVDVTVTDRFGTKIIPLGKNFDLSGYNYSSASTSWGKANVYFGIERKENPKHAVLSSGIYQFATRWFVRGFEWIPYDIIVDIESDVEAEHPDYPFNNQREGFRARIRPDIDSLQSYLAALARGEEARMIQQNFKNVKKLTRVNFAEELPVDMEATWEEEAKETKEQEFKLPESVFIFPDEVKTSDGSVFSRPDKNTNRKDSTFEAEKDAPKIEEFLQSIDASPNIPIYHNNTNMQPTTFGDSGQVQTLFSELGSIVLEMKEAYAKSKLVGAASLKEGVYAGISLDKKYGGAFIKVPYNGIFLNPLGMNFKPKNLFGYRRIIYNTIIHEIAHSATMGHGPAHNSAMDNVSGYFADIGLEDYFQDNILKVLTKHETLYKELVDEFNKSTTKNLAKSFKDIKENTAGASISGYTGRPLDALEALSAREGPPERPGVPGAIPTGEVGAERPGAREPDLGALAPTPTRTAAIDRRLAAVQKQFPDIDEAKARQILKAWPKATPEEVNKLASDPALFNKVMQASVRLEQRRREEGVRKKEAQPGLFGEEPPQGRLFFTPEGRYYEGETISARAFPKGEHPLLASRETSGWVIDSLRADPELTEAERAAYQNTKYSETLATRAVIHSIVRRLEDLGIETPVVPVEDAPTSGALIYMDDGSRFFMFDNKFSDTYLMSVLNHEIHHERLRMDDPIAHALTEEVDTTSEAFQQYEKYVNGIYRELNWEPLSELDVAEELAADFVANIRRLTYEGKIINLQDAFLDPEIRDALLTTYTMWKPGKAPQVELPPALAPPAGIKRTVPEDFLLGVEGRREPAEVRQQWTPETPMTFKQFRREFLRDNEALKTRLEMPGNQEIPLYVGEEFTDRAGNQIRDRKGRIRFLNEQEIWERFYKPQNTRYIDLSGENVPPNPLLPPEGTIEPPPAIKPGYQKGLTRSLLEKISVARISELASKAHQSLIEHMGWASHEMDKQRKALEKFVPLFKGMDQEAINEFTDLAETGRIEEVSPELQEAAKVWRRLSDGLHFLIAEQKGGLFNYWTDYFPRMVKNPELAQQVISDYMASHGRRGGGAADFLKARTMLLSSKIFKPRLMVKENAEGGFDVIKHDLYENTYAVQQSFDNRAEAENMVNEKGGLGLEPIDPNYVNQMKANLWEKTRWLMDNYFKNDLEATGFLSTKKQYGWVPVSDKGIWRGYWAHPDLASVLEKHLSPGMRNDPLYRTYYTPFTFMNEVYVGFSAFHATFTMLSYLSHGIGMNLPRAIGSALTGNFKSAKFHLDQMKKFANLPSAIIEGGKYVKEWQEPGSYPELSETVGILERAGIRVKADFNQVTQSFAEALRESQVALPRQITQLFAAPIMQWLVPRMKIIATVRRLEVELFHAKEQAVKEGRTLSRDETTKLAQQVSREVDNIYGQMVYDNLGMKRGWKDLLAIFIGFPGWNIGSFTKLRDAVLGVRHLVAEPARMAGEAITGTKPEWRQMDRMQRMGAEFYVGMMLVMAVGGALLQRLLAGEWPKDSADLFMPRTGALLPNGQPERVRMPTYMRDVMSLSHPIAMVQHKMAFPIRLSSELINNQDFFGTEIVDRWAPKGEQAAQLAEYLGQSLLPFGIQGYLKTVGPKAKSLNLIGITKVPRAYTNSPAMNLIDEYNRMTRATVTSRETAAMKHLKAELREMARAQDENGFLAAAQKAVSEGTLTNQQVKEVVSESQLPPGLSRFTKLPLVWSLRVWEAANQEEKDGWRPFLLKKIMTEKPERLVRLKEPVARVLNNMGIGGAADMIRDMTISPEDIQLDLSKLGELKPPPEMDDFSAIDYMMQQQISKNLLALLPKIPKRISRPRLRENKFEVLGL